MIKSDGVESVEIRLCSASSGRQASAIVEDIHVLKDSRTGMTTLQNINDSVRYAEVELRNDALRCRV